MSVFQTTMRQKLYVRANVWKLKVVWNIQELAFKPLNSNHPNKPGQPYEEPIIYFFATAQVNKSNIEKVSFEINTGHPNKPGQPYMRSTLYVC